MASHNITRYFAETDSFVGSDDLTIREALRGLFWNRYRIRETNQKRAALAIILAERGLPCLPCTLSEPACTGRPAEFKESTNYLRLNKFDGSMTFIDANGIFRFRICVGYDVEEVDKTFPETVAHINVLVRVSHS